MNHGRRKPKLTFPGLQILSHHGGRITAESTLHFGGGAELRMDEPAPHLLRDDAMADGAEPVLLVDVGTEVTSLGVSKLSRFHREQTTEMSTQPQLLHRVGGGVKELTTLVDFLGKIRPILGSDVLLEQLEGRIQPSDPGTTEQQLGLTQIAAEEFDADAQAVTDVKHVPTVPHVVPGFWPTGTPVLRMQLHVGGHVIFSGELWKKRRKTRTNKNRSSGTEKKIGNGRTTLTPRSSSTRTARAYRGPSRRPSQSPSQPR